MNKRLKNMVISYKASDNRAITLIALVITIVIMIILASISIQAITNTGLIGKAKRARDDTNYAAAAEKVALAVSSSYNNYGEQDNGLLTENINNIKGLDKKIDEITDDSYTIEIVVDGFKFQISKDWSITGEKKQVATLPENTKNTTAGTPVKIPDKWTSQTVSYVNTSTKEVKTISQTVTVSAIADGDGNTIPVPLGFWYVGGTQSTGVIISDNENDKNTEKISHDDAVNLKGNQFVWIPCDANSYQKIDFGNTYKNAEWDRETNEAEYAQIEKYGGFYVARYEAGVATVDSSGNYTDSVKFGNNKLYNAVSVQSGVVSGWGWQNYNFLARDSKSPQAMSKTAGTSSGTIISKANSIPWFHSDYWTACAASRAMYSTDSVQSTLVSGTQWDMIMKFICGGTDYSIVKNGTTWGNYYTNSISGLRGAKTTCDSSGNTAAWTKITDANNSTTANKYEILTTGSSASLLKNGLYDIAGNLWEWTQEASYVYGVSYNNSSNSDKNKVDINSYMLRGGSFGSDPTTRPACYREYDNSSGTGTDSGFRPALYIK